MSIFGPLRPDIANRWLAVFPELTSFSIEKLYKVLGNTIIGLELIKLPRTPEYRPHFVVYSLWKSTLAENLRYPIILLNFYDHKKSTFNIPLSDFKMTEEVILNVKNQLPLSLEGDVSLQALLSLIEKCANQRPLNAAPFSFLQADLHASKFKIALYHDIGTAQRVLEEILSKPWIIEHFEDEQITLRSWLSDLQNLLTNRNALLTAVEQTLLDPKVLRLKKSSMYVQ